MSFIHCFARKSKIFHRIDLNPTEGAHDKEKTSSLAPQNLPKYAIFRSQNKKFAHPRLFFGGEGVFPVERGTPLPTSHLLRRFVPPTLNSRWRHC